MAAEQIETVNTGADRVKLIVSALMVIAGIVGFYVLAKQGALAQWGVLIVAITAAVALFVSSESGGEFVAFGRDAWREAKKVVWPSRKESMQMTGYVFAFVVVMALFLWLTDKSLEWLIFSLILGWR
jgi:preprotein translocase subunit SecE